MNPDLISGNRHDTAVVPVPFYLKWLILPFAAMIFLPAVLSASQKGQKQLDLTVYQGFGWIQDTRTFELVEGSNEIRFPGIARQLDTGSVRLESDGELISLRTDMGHYGWDDTFEDLKGEQVRLISSYGELVEGKISDYVHGRLYLEKSDGKYTMIPNPHSYRVELKELPGPPASGANILARVNMHSAGEFPVTLSYVLGNIGWRMDYSLVVDEDTGTGVLTGLAGIRNDTGTDFKQASVRLVAGQINVRPGHFHAPADARGEVAAMAEQADTQPDRYSDFYVYEISEKLDLEKHGMYQVPLVSSEKVSFRKQYRHMIRPFSGSSDDPQNADIRFIFYNTEEDGLGKPLPAGNARVYAREAEGSVRLIGQDRISHTSSGDEIRLGTGKAFDIRVIETVTGREEISRNVREEDRKITAKNESEEPVTVTLELPLHRNITVTASDTDPVSETADRKVYEISVPAEGEQTFSITLRQGN